MSNDEIFRQMVKNAYDEYRMKRLEQVNAAIEAAMPLIESNKEVEFNYSKISVMAIGQRFSIVYDGHLFAIMNNIDCKLFSPCLGISDAYQIFKELECENISNIDQ